MVWGLVCIGLLVLFLGEGYWRWKINDFKLNDSFENFDELINLKDTILALKDFEYSAYLNPKAYSALFRIASISYVKKEFSKSVEV